MLHLYSIKKLQGLDMQKLHTNDEMARRVMGPAIGMYESTDHLIKQPQNSALLGGNVKVSLEQYMSDQALRRSGGVLGSITLDSSAKGGKKDQ